jgi:hypothetical protein
LNWSGDLAREDTRKGKLESADRRNKALDRFVARRHDPTVSQAMESRGPAAPEPIRVPRKEVMACVGGAGHAFSDLPDIARRAGARLQMSDKPITQADINELLRILAETQTTIKRRQSRSPNRLFFCRSPAGPAAASRAIRAA